MASRREERRELRKRGAGSHHIRDVDFGFNFPAQAPPNSRTPRDRINVQPDLSASRTRRNTPATRGLRTPSARKNATPSASTRINNEPSASKRRKLEHRQSRTPKEKTPNASESVENGDDEPEGDAPAEQLSDIDELEGVSEVIDILPLPASVKGKAIALQSVEITESPKHAPGSGRRRPTDIKAKETPGKEIVSKGSSSVKTPKQRQRGSVGNVRDRDLSPDLSSLPTSRNERLTLERDDMDELSPEQPVRKQSEARFSSVEGETENAEAIDDLVMAQELGKTKRKRRQAVSGGPVEVIGDGSAPEASGNLEEQEQDELDPTPRKATPPFQKKRKGPASPAVQRQPKKSKERAPPRQTIPVTVHRFTNPLVYGDDDTEADILNQNIPFSKRGGVNTVDVLAQICEEVIDAGLETLEEGGMNAEDVRTRKEYRTKLRAVEAFQEELRTQLLELTIILDTNYALGKRFRASQSELLHLREELLKIKGERENIALKADSIRIKHEENSKIFEEQSSLNASFHDIELAVERCRALSPSKSQATTDPSLETLLQGVASIASSISSEGGMLKKVRDFNTFLERAALALEGHDMNIVG